MASKQLTVPDDLEMVTDAEWLNVDGSIPTFIDNCEHTRLGAPMPTGTLRIHACKDCGLVAMPAMRRPARWEMGTARVSLPVTMEKLLDTIISATLRMKP